MSYTNADRMQTERRAQQNITCNSKRGAAQVAQLTNLKYIFGRAEQVLYKFKAFLFSAHPKPITLREFSFWVQWSGYFLLLIHTQSKDYRGHLTSECQQIIFD